ncbi:WecB/TagA/CpsF family glycosyltransferase [Bacillus sp. RO1]|uniref:WecB/TagA/CpsF family glycosyltransferase n=1 Tax=Bacillus sp. RO1 TaxID=2722703 RepID=UPI003216ED6C
MSNIEKILDVNVTTLNYRELITSIDALIQENGQGNIIAVNPEKIMALQKDPKLKDLINSATYTIPDGIGVILASRLNKGTVTERITGVDLFVKLLELADKKRYKIFLYGAKPEVVAKAVENIKRDYPNLIVAGYRDGYVSDQQELVEEINASGAQLMFVAMGSPKQEFWIEENKGKLSVNIFQGVGGSFDVISGTVKRAPAAFRNTGTEWLYRLLSQPSRIQRQMALPKFLLKVLGTRPKK